MTRNDHYYELSNPTHSLTHRNLTPTRPDETMEGSYWCVAVSIGL